MFRKKKEYLVLTGHSLTRYKSQTKAAEAYSVIAAVARSTSTKHGQVPSHGSSGDFYPSSDPAEDRVGKVLLSQIVAVHLLSDGKPYFALELCYLDEDSGQASSLTLQFNNPGERRSWLDAIREMVSEVRKHDERPISSFNLENAARAVERDQDYDPNNCAIFKIVQRHSTGKSNGRSSTDDLTKVASVVCFLAIGVHKVHLIPLAKPVSRASSPALTNLQSASSSFGTLTLAAISVSDIDDTFDISFRSPLQRQKTLHFSASASFDIIARLYHCENLLRPESTHRFFQFDIPLELEAMLPPSVVSTGEEYNSLDRTLTAYCVAYGVNPGSVCYSVNHECEDAPRFDLLPPLDPKEHSYGPLELLAVMRTLRYNESFASISFSGISLDCLNGLHDNYGKEFVCTRTKHGTMIKLPPDQLTQACLLVQEVRALAATSKRLRRFDFTNCVNIKSEHHKAQNGAHSPSELHGSGVVEALLPLCRQQITNVDWICLNGIVLNDIDLDYLVGAAVDRACHFRAIELNSCGLSDRALGLMLDSLRAHDNTLEAIDIAGNAARIEPLAFDNQISVFGFIRKLDLSNISRTSGPEPLLRSETLAIWRLSEVRLTGTTLNIASVDALATYLACAKSDSLHFLYLDNTYLTAADIATLLRSMVRGTGEVRQMHLDVSQNDINKGLEQLTSAIVDNMTPVQMSLRAIEYREESAFRRLLSAFADNTSTQILDISQTALPADASEECCRALSHLLSQNNTIVDLNLSGEESRLAVAKFGAGINKALLGVKQNTTLRTLRIERQKLGLQGANTLADVLSNNACLQELFCGNNEIPLTGLTELVNALINNTTLIYLPQMDDGRAAAFKSAERAMMQMGSALPAPTTPPTSRSVSYGGGTNTLKKGLSVVKRTAQRTTSHHAPSFPALGSRLASPRPSPPAAPRLSMSSSRRLSTDLLGSSSPISFTVQDVHTTHRLLSEQWDRQCYRLAQYLERNWCLLNNISVAMEIEDEKFERPESAGSLAKMLEEVKIETTPRVERDIYFDAVSSPTDEVAVGRNGDKSLLSFKQFILDDGSGDHGTDEELKQARLGSGLREGLGDPKTPTQQAFNL